MLDPNRKPPSIQDVARIAGVTASTVSRVLNDKPDVSSETRKRVLQTIADLNYHPNAQAISLSMQRTGIVGLVVQDITHIFCTAIMESVHNTLQEHGFWLLVANGTLDTEEHAQQQHRLIEQLWRSRRVDGLLVLTPVDSSRAILREIANEKFPCVLIDSDLNLTDIRSVVVDNYHGSYLATEHLLSLGYREIAHLGGPKWVPSGRERLTGFQAALNEWGVSVRPEWTIPGQGFDEQTGRQGMATLLSLPERPRAVFAACDYIAFGAIRAIKAANLRIPEDIAIVGFDDIPLAARFDPALTTVRQPLNFMGKTATEILCRWLTGREDVRPEPGEITVKTELVVRSSCGFHSAPHHPITVSDQT